MTTHPPHSAAHEHATGEWHQSTTQEPTPLGAQAAKQPNGISFPSTLSAHHRHHQCISAHHPELLVSKNSCLQLDKFIPETVCTPSLNTATTLTRTHGRLCFPDSGVRNTILTILVVQGCGVPVHVIVISQAAHHTRVWLLQEQATTQPRQRHTPAPNKKVTCCAVYVVNDSPHPQLPLLLGLLN